MTALLKVKEHHLPKCLGCHSFVETMKISNHRIQDLKRSTGHAKVARDAFDSMLDLFTSSEETVGSAGLTVSEGACLYHWWHRVNRGHLLITDRGDGTIAKLATNATKGRDEWIRREVHLIGPTRKPEDEDIGEWVKYQNNEGGQKNRIKWVAGDPTKLTFMEGGDSTRKIFFSMVYIPSGKDIELITKNYWQALESGGMGDFEITSQYASIGAEGGMIAIRGYEKDDTVTEWVDQLCESGHTGMLDRADSLVILGKIHITLEGV